MIYFEPVIERLVPPYRHGNFWARSNRFDNPRLNGKSNRQIFQLVASCNNLEDVVSLMNNGSNRNFGWNFINIYSGGAFTIEFRHGPGATRPDTCLQWVEFATIFIHAAKCEATESQLEVYSRDVEGLRHFFRGYQLAGGHESVLDQLFVNKSGSTTPSRIGDLGSADAAKVRAKDKEAMRKNTIGRKFVAA